MYVDENYFFDDYLVDRVDKDWLKYDAQVVRWFDLFRWCKYEIFKYGLLVSCS